MTADEAIPILERNLDRIIGRILPQDREEVVLTGRVPPWVYMVAYGAVWDLFGRVYFSDGKKKTLLWPRPRQQ